jgi:hypothetical protein
MTTTSAVWTTWREGTDDLVDSEGTLLHKLRALVQSSPLCFVCLQRVQCLLNEVMLLHLQVLLLHLQLLLLQLHLLDIREQGPGRRPRLLFLHQTTVNKHFPPKKDK